MGKPRGPGSGIKGEVDVDRRALFADGLARGLSVAEAARQAGYSKVQAFRIKRKKEFLDQVEKRRKELGTQPAASPTSKFDEQLVGHGDEALAFLGRVMSGKQSGTHEQIAAAKAILGHAVKLRPPRKPTPCHQAQAGTGDEEREEGAPRRLPASPKVASDDEAERFLDEAERRAEREDDE